MLKACPSYAQTEVQVVHEADGSTKVQHEKLCQPGHKAMCLAFALQGMSQKHMHSAAAASSLQKPISVHDAPSLQPSSDLAIAVIGVPLQFTPGSLFLIVLVTQLQVGHNVHAGVFLMTFVRLNFPKGGGRGGGDNVCHCTK